MSTSGGQRPHEPVTVPVLTVPALLGFLILGAGATLLLGPWAGIGVLVVLLGAAWLAARHPGQKEVAIAAALGVVVGYAAALVVPLLNY